LKGWVCILLILLCTAMLTACRRGSPKIPEIPPVRPAETEIPRSQAEITEFSYYGNGSHTGAIFSYDVCRSEDSDGYIVNLQLHAGNIEHTLSADKTFMEKLREIVRKHDLWKWNGFHKTAQGMLDGSSFGLRISFADGSCIGASGDNRFPDGYSDASADIRALFNELMKKNGIETNF